MDILILKPKWSNKVFKNNKTWEIRGTSTSKRGRIAIGVSGTSCVQGTVELVDCILLTKELWMQNIDKHQVGISWEDLLRIYPRPHAWVFEDAVELENKVPYHHKPGAVIWVKDNNILL